MSSGIIQSIYRYPVKGLSPQALRRVRLAVGDTLPADRPYAIENGPLGFDPTNPTYFPKQRFLMLMKNERLAALDARFDEASHTLTIIADGEEAARGNLHTAEGRAAIEAAVLRSRRLRHLCRGDRAGRDRRRRSHCDRRVLMLAIG